VEPTPPRAQTGERAALWISRFHTLLVISPNAAVIDTFAVVERLLRRVAGRRSLALSGGINEASGIASQLASAGLIPISAAALVSTMQQLRNSAAHGAVVDATDALRFRDLANRIGRVLFDAADPLETRIAARRRQAAEPDKVVPVGGGTP
jgi:hypothetical protein